jgi:acetolactate synthase-1/3 small subunit
MAETRDPQDPADSPPRTLSILVENRFGVLSRIAGLFSARGYNIESLTVAVSADPTLSRITMVVRCGPRLVAQLMKQVHKLLDVVRIEDLTGTDSVERELILIRVRASDNGRRALMNVAEAYQARMVKVTPDHCVFEATGDPETIDAFIDVVRPFIDEMVRTGRVAVPHDARARGEDAESLHYSGARRNNS